ncbi:MAG: S-adenosylmethionine decarboxylase [Candidatus Pacearchaeota archaeon]
MAKKIWGQTLSLDLSECAESILKSKKKLKEFCIELCKLLKMKRFGNPIIKRFGEGELEGYSAMQFIFTSSITIHADEYNSRAFIDIFSCKFFDKDKAKEFCKKFFEAKKVRSKNFYRY